MAIPIKSSEEIDQVRTAGRALWSVLDVVLAACRPGVISRELDALARHRILAAGAEPILSGYTQAGAPPFPGAACICINEEAVHAPPSSRILRPGDIVTIDIALRLSGWCADAARSLIVPGDPAPPMAPPETVARLLAATRAAADSAAGAMLPGVRWSSIAAIMQRIAADAGLSAIPGYSGHGIGRALHEAPRVWSALPFAPASPEPDFTLRPGMVLTVEPIFSIGRAETLALSDGWTVLSADRSPVCHEERTVAITRSAPLILTAP